MTRANTTEVNADLATLLERATRGPWELDGIAIAGNDLRGSDVCLMGEPAQYAGDTSRMLDNWQANAALIARAPDLAADVLRLTTIVADLTAALRAAKGQVAAQVITEWLAKEAAK